jgi:hypothetical protein
MNSPRFAIMAVLVLLAFGAAASSAVAATSRLVPSVPWLSAAPAAHPSPPTPVPRSMPVTRPAPPTGALPNTGFPVWFELLGAGILVCSGTAIRGRARRDGLVRREPALAGRR